VMTIEERAIYECCEDIVFVPFDSNKLLADYYAFYNKNYFNDALPHLSEQFICMFQPLPNDKEGISIDSERAGKLSTSETTVRAGIRINSKLECFKKLARQVLLHEMIHVMGIKAHNDAFTAAIHRLVKAGAFNDLIE
jgi:hypothetical protein